MTVKIKNMSHGDVMGKISRIMIIYHIWVFIFINLLLHDENDKLLKFEKDIYPTFVSKSCLFHRIYKLLYRWGAHAHSLGSHLHTNSILIWPK